MVEENQVLKDFHEELFNEVTAGATAGSDFLQRSFFNVFCEYLDVAGEIELPEYAYYTDPQGGKEISGYHFDISDNGNSALNLFITIYSGDNGIVNINKKEIDATFKKLENFFRKSIDGTLERVLEISSDGYEVASQIYSKKGSFRTVNLYLFTDKKLSTRTTAIPSKELEGYIVNYHLWDLSKLFKIVSSENVAQDIVVDFMEEFGCCLPALPVDLEQTDYKAYLSVVPGKVLAKLYEKYGAKLMERNVRTFLQAKGKVNSGIRKTILKEPERFFAYNNGITATAERVDFEGDKICSLTNLQIVNGGQTTASLFNTYYRDKANLDNVYVQMKLSEVSSDMADEMVPSISKFANSQNKVNDADFFAVHQFHKRIEEFSRRIWAPAVDGQFMQTKWFYERARGQYMNELAFKTEANKKKFILEYPKKQLFTKTDLAKFEGVWTQQPDVVSKGAQYIFMDYADRINKEWEKDNTVFNEAYYKMIIAKAIIFKATEKVVTDATWYDGGYRANIVAYSLSYLAYRLERMDKSIDFLSVWNKQKISDTLKDVLQGITQLVHDNLIHNGTQILSNIGQFCKKRQCWEMVQKISFDFPAEFFKELVDNKDILQDIKEAKSDQKMTNNMLEEVRVVNIGEKNWRNLQVFAAGKRMLTDKESGILAYYFTRKSVTSKQAKVLLDLLARMENEGFSLV